MFRAFPDDFRFAGTQTHRYRQIGNAVPVLLAEAIGRAVLEALARPLPSASDDRDDEFRARLLEWHESSGIESPPWRSRGRALGSFCSRSFRLTRAPTPTAERS